MEVRATIPIRAYLIAATPEDLAPTTQFVHKRLTVGVRFDGDEPADLPGPPVQHFRRLHSMEIRVGGDDKLKQLVDSEDGWPLLNLTVGAANRVMTAVRNFGQVAHLQPLRVSPDETDRWLRALRVQVSEDGESWTPVRGTETLEEMLSDRFVLTRENVGEMQMRQWPAVEEALQDGLKPGAEREFFTNALEHLRVANLRLAVVESVICLEIVLSEWLHQILPSRGVSDTKLNKLLRPQVDLSTRLGLLLPLLVSPEELARIKHDDVTRTVRYRNGVVHETGNLPEGLDPVLVKEGVWAVLTLAMNLADKRDELRRMPHLDAIAREVAASHGVPLPRIRNIGPHSYTAAFNLPFVDFPGDEKLAAVAADLTERMTQLDARFRPDANVWIVFKQGDPVIAVWVDGQIKHTKNKPADLSAILNILTVATGELGRRRRILNVGLCRISDVLARHASERSDEMVSEPPR